VLHGCPEGTYLVRFSQSAVTGFAVAFVVADGSVEQVLVRSEVGRGFVLEGGTCCVILPLWRGSVHQPGDYAKHACLLWM
jgi:hypothetical protein